MAFSGTFKTLLNVHEERDAGKVVFSLIKSSFMKDFEGQWQVNCSAHMSCMRKLQQNCSYHLLTVDTPVKLLCVLCVLVTVHAAACAAVQHLTLSTVGTFEYVSCGGTMCAPTHTCCCVYAVLLCNLLGGHAMHVTSLQS